MSGRYTYWATASYPRPAKPGRWPTPAFRAAHFGPATMRVFLVAIVLFSPMFARSNPAVTSMFWAVLLGVFSLGTFVFAPTTAIETCKRWGLLLSFGLVISFFGFCQSLPLASFGAFPTIEFPFGPVTYPSISLLGKGSIVEAIRVTSLTIFFALCLWAFRDPLHVPKAARAVLYGIAAFSLSGLFDLRSPAPGIGATSAALQWELAIGPFLNHNTFATYLGMGLVLGTALLASQNGCFVRFSTIHWAIPVCTGLILIAALFTQSRAGISATVLALAVLVAKLRPARSHGVLSAIFFFLLFLILSGFSFGLWERFVWISAAAQTRADLYFQVIEMIGARPVLGFGAGAFPWAFEGFHHPPVASDFVWNRSHSTYLALWVDYGLVIGSLPIVAGATTARWLLNSSRHSGPGRPYPIVGFAALILGGAHSLVDFSLEIQANSFLLLFLVALGLSATPPGLEGSVRSNQDLIPTNMNSSESSGEP